MNKNVRINFNLEMGEDGYPPVATERLWALPLANGNFEIDNIPFYVMKISSGDEVSAANEGAELFFRGLVTPSGNSTFRLLLTDPKSSEVVRKYLTKIHCNSEFNQHVGVIAVEIPHNVDIHPFLEYIVTSQERGELDIEESALRHDIN